MVTASVKLQVLVLFLVACRSETRHSDSMAPRASHSLETASTSKTSAQQSPPADSVVKSGPGWYCVERLTDRTHSYCLETSDRCAKFRDRVKARGMDLTQCKFQDVAYCYSYGDTQDKESSLCTSSLAVCETRRAFSRGVEHHVGNCTRKEPPKYSWQDDAVYSDALYCIDVTGDSTLERFACYFTMNDCGLAASNMRTRVERVVGQRLLGDVTVSTCKRSMESASCGAYDRFYICSGLPGMCGLEMSRVLQGNTYKGVIPCTEWRPTASRNTK